MGFYAEMGHILLYCHEVPALDHCPSLALLTLPQHLQHKNWWHVGLILHQD